MTFNQEQKEAIYTTEGPLLIIAGPGSGKTKTLVGRCSHIIGSGKARAEEITVTTFSKKASLELFSRIDDSTGKIHIENFHQLSQRILQSFLQFTPFKAGYQVLDGEEQLAFLLRSYPGVDSLWEARKFQRLINQFREGFVDLSQSKEAFEMVNHYQSLLYEYGYLDYPAILFEAYKLLKERKEVLLHFQKQAKYLMVDEYQDTNPIQEKIIGLLSSATRNLCVVGDDDQSLYRFRGASVYNILSFSKRYEGAKTISLHTNYRSKKDILDFSSTFIDYPYWDMENGHEKIQDQRYKKKLIAFREDSSKTVFTLLADREEDLYEKILKAIFSIYEKTGTFRSMVFLSHSIKNEKMTKLISYLRQHDIPLHIEKDGSLLTYLEVRRMIGLYGLLFKDDSYRHFAEELANKGEEEREKAISYLQKKIHTEGLDPVEIGQIFLGLDPFCSIIERALEGNSLALRQAEHLSVLLQWIKSFCEKEKISLLTGDTQAQFSSLLFSSWIPFLQEARVDARNDQEEEVVLGDFLRIMTIHQSKGLEFPIVFLYEPNQRKFFERQDPLDAYPRSKDLGTKLSQAFEDKIDDYRLYYTAFTRAKDLLILIGVDENLSVDYYLEGKRRNSAISPIFKGIHGSLPAFSKVPDDLSSMQVEKSVKEYAFTTDIAIYSSCPRKYLFEGKLKFPTKFSKEAAYGSILHKLLESYHRGIPIDQDYLSYFPMEEDKDRLLKAVEKYIENLGERVKKSSPIVEEMQRVDCGDFLLKGKPDLISQRGEWLIDFKTGYPKEKSIAIYKEQLIFYRYLYHRLETPLEESKNLLYFTKEDVEENILEIDITEEDLFNFEKKMKKSICAIEKEDFQDRTQDVEICQFCSMNYFCNPPEFLDL